MKTIKFKRFTKLNFLKQIGRDLLGQFFNRYNDDLAEKGVVMPAATLDDDAYFGAVAKIAMSPEGLPDDLVDTAHALEGMTNEEGQERLERATGENGLAFQFRENSSCAEIAMQAWLANPEVFAEKFNEQKLTRLGDVLPVGRSNEDEAKLVAGTPQPAPVAADPGAVTLPATAPADNPPAQLPTKNL